jgi:hypothetical protein
MLFSKDDFKIKDMDDFVEFLLCLFLLLIAPFRLVFQGQARHHK